MIPENELTVITSFKDLYKLTHQGHWSVLFNIIDLLWKTGNILKLFKDVGYIPSKKLKCIKCKRTYAMISFLDIRKFPNISSIPDDFFL